jgi:hypothetical protein
VREAYAFEIRADVYRMHRRVGEPQIVVNDDYRGLRVIDLWSGEDVARFPFPEERQGFGVIDAWAFRADGDLAAVFEDESRSACIVSLRDGTRQAIEHPSWPVTTGMPYHWRGDTLWLKDPESFAFAALDPRTGAFTEDDGLRALQTNRAWRRALDRMRRRSAACERVEPELEQFLVIVHGDHPHVGRIGWADQPDRLHPTIRGVARLASLGESLVALAEYELVVLDERGIEQSRHAAPKGFHFLDVETLPSSNGQPAAVVTAASALDGSGITRFTVLSEGHAR